MKNLQWKIVDTMYEVLETTNGIVKAGIRTKLEDEVWNIVQGRLGLGDHRWDFRIEDQWFEGVK